MLIFVESILNSTENNIINKSNNNIKNNKSVWGDKVNAQNDDYVEVEATTASAADVQQEVEVTKGNHFSSAYGNIVMTTKRQLNEDKMSRPIIQTTTTTETHSRNDTDDNMIGSIMVPLPPELSDKLTIENFNSRRRRGRLRTSSCPLLLLPSPWLPLYNNINNNNNTNKQNQMMMMMMKKKKKKVKIVDNANATKNILAAIEPIKNTTTNTTSTSILLSKLLLLLLLLSFLIKYYVNKLKDKLINSTAACASKLFAIYNHINYNGKRSSLKYNIQQQQYQQQKHHHHHNYNSYYKHSHNAGLVYAFLLCTSILLPSNTNLAMAFKPKSVQTQLQQQEQQQQQHNQHHQTNHHQQTTANDNNNNHNNKNSEAYEMLPIPQDDDAEFLSSQSQEHLFDGEKDEQNSNLSLNEEIAADMYDTHRNGE